MPCDMLLTMPKLPVEKLYLQQWVQARPIEILFLSNTLQVSQTSGVPILQTIV